MHTCTHSPLLIHAIPPPTGPNKHQLPPLLAALLGNDPRHLRRAHLPHVHVVHRHQLVPHVNLTTNRTRVLDGMHHGSTAVGGSVDDQPQLSGGGVDFEVFLPGRWLLSVVRWGFAEVDVAVVVSGVGPRYVRGGRHGSEGGGGVGEVGEGLVVGVEGAAGVGEAEVAGVDLFVVGVHCWDAVVVVVVLFAVLADIGREAGW